MEKKSKSIFLIVLICILVAVAGGSASWYYLRDAHDQETQALENEIDRLENDIKTLTNKTSETTHKETTRATNPTTTDETANWKTYTNTTEHFSFRYPTDWQIYIDPSTPKRVYLQTCNKLAECKGEITKATVPEGFARIWLSHDPNEFTGNVYNTSDCTTVSLADKDKDKVTLYECVPTDEGSPLAFAKIKNPYTFTTATELGAIIYQKEVAMLKSIIPTFSSVSR